MTERFKHGKIKTYFLNDDGSITTEKESFFENPAAYEREITMNVRTGRDKFLSDVISALDVISNKQSKTLTITIKTDEYYTPVAIEKSWIEQKDTVKRSAY